MPACSNCISTRINGGQTNVGSLGQQDLEHVFGRHVSLIRRALKNFQDLDAGQRGLEPAAFQFFGVGRENSGAAPGKRAARMGNHIDWDAGFGKVGSSQIAMTLNLIRRALPAGPCDPDVGWVGSPASLAEQARNPVRPVWNPIGSMWCRATWSRKNSSPRFSLALGACRFVKSLGSLPLLTDVFNDRWDYVFTIRRQGVPDQSVASPFISE